ncbi:MAG: DUF4430 domain-containing protein [Clostridia bacterium]|nr:DUF4430 domain-containing protein [Clostridia bacterium]
MKKTTKVVIGVLALVLVAAALIGVYIAFGPKTSEGSKNVTITVVDDKGEKTVYNVKTDAEYLRGAMDEAEGLTYGGTEGEYGIMIDTVNGLRADYTLDGAYWSFMQDGAMTNYGIDTQPIKDGDAFSIEYTPAQ